MDQLRNKLEQAVGQRILAEVDRVNENLVKQALTLMKSNKCDALFEFQSDCLINGPPELIQHLTYLLRSYITHGIVPCFILLCTLLPLVKDNLGDITSSENYRAIASGSLLLKLLDLVILLLEGDKLECDSLQFGFQQPLLSLTSSTRRAVQCMAGALQDLDKKRSETNFSEDTCAHLQIPAV